MMAGHVQAQCLSCAPSHARMDVVQAEIAALFAQQGCQPEQVQTDRAPCFLGAEARDRLAVPSRLTLWLAGLGIRHQLIPVRQPHRNGAVERFHGAVEHSWRDEVAGLEALRAVWNVEKPPLDAAHQPYRGQAHFRMERVWALLARVRVWRRVDVQGKVGLFNRQVRVGREAAGQEVEVSFDAEQRQVVIRDVHAVVRCTPPLPWLTAEWLWEPVPLTDQAPHVP